MTVLIWSMRNEFHIWIILTFPLQWSNVLFRIFSSNFASVTKYRALIFQNYPKKKVFVKTIPRKATGVKFDEKWKTEILKVLEWKMLIAACSRAEQNGDRFYKPWSAYFWAKKMYIHFLRSAIIWGNRIVKTVYLDNQTVSLVIQS